MPFNTETNADFGSSIIESRHSSHSQLWYVMCVVACYKCSLNLCYKLCVVTLGIGLLPRGFSCVWKATGLGVFVVWARWM